MKLVYLKNLLVSLFNKKIDLLNGFTGKTMFLGRFIGYLNPLTFNHTVANATVVNAQGNMFRVNNPYAPATTLNLKGQMHAHTTNSDGSYSLTETINVYKNAGYDFVAITDHNVVTDTSYSMPDGMVWIGNAYEDTRNTAGWQHMNIYKSPIPVGVTSIYQTTNTPLSLRNHFAPKYPICFNHPEDEVVYASDAFINALPYGIAFVECYNSCVTTYMGEVATTSALPTNALYGDTYLCRADNKQYRNAGHNLNSPNWVVNSWEFGNIERAFPMLLDKGFRIWGLAVDDFHFMTIFNRGWVQVFCNNKTKEDIWNSLLNGNFYACAGLTINKPVLNQDNWEITATESGCTFTFYGFGNEVLQQTTGTSAKYYFTGNEKYVRCVVSKGRKKAWVQPISFCI